MKDLSHLHYILGLEVHRDSASLFPSQTKYIHDLLQHAQLIECNPVSTPMIVGHHQDHVSNTTLYHSLVGAL